MRSGTLLVLVATALLAAAPPAPGAEPVGRWSPDAPALFPRPPGMEARVRFWTRVFTEVDTRGGFIHDNEHLDIVYDVIRWPAGLSAREETARYESAKAQVRAILRRLARGSHEHLSAEERRILALFPKGVSRKALAAAAERVRFQRGQADKFRDGLIRSGRWEDHIARVFAERGLPPELAVLPHIESSFNPHARSHAGAAGLWQFMPSTARRFELRVDHVLDERYDPFRASAAAAEFLADNHRILQSWPLAITAYNHGPGGMARAVRQLGTRDIEQIIRRYDGRTFGFASRNFYPEFLAVVDIERDLHRYFGPIARDRPTDDEVVVTDASYSVRALAAAFGLDLGMLRELNPALRDGVWRGRHLVPPGYALRVPRVEGRPPAATVLASVPKASPQQVRGRTHLVRRGETLSRIARRYGVSTTALAAANDIRDPSRIRAGHRLRIPGDLEEAVALDAVSRRPPVPAAARTHVVRPGDTLGAIARRYGTTVAALAAANGIDDPRRIRVGQRLHVPGGGAVAASGAPLAGTVTRTHVVKRGDTLSSIARRYGSSVQQIVAANNLARADRIRAGQRLRVPVGGG